MWTEADRTRIQIHQHRRVCELLHEPDLGIMIDFASSLHLTCNTPAQVDRLLKNPHKLQRSIWLATGLETISIWFAQELVWQSGEELESELIQFEPDLKEQGMATATIAKAVMETAKEVLPEIIGGIVAEEQQNAQAADLKAEIINAFKSEEFTSFLRNEVRSQLHPGNSTNGTATITAEPTTTEAPAKARRKSAASPATKRKTTRKPTRRTTKAEA